MSSIAETMKTKIKRLLITETWYALDCGSFHRGSSCRPHYLIVQYLVHCSKQVITICSILMITIC